MTKDKNLRLQETAAKQHRGLRVQKNTFAVIFIIQKGKIRDDDTVSIVTRITVNREMVHFATRMHIRPDCWLPNGRQDQSGEANQQDARMKSRRLSRGR